MFPIRRGMKRNGPLHKRWRRVDIGRIMERNRLLRNG